MKTKKTGQLGTELLDPQKRQRLQCIDSKIIQGQPAQQEPDLSPSYQDGQGKI